MSEVIALRQLANAIANLQVGFLIRRGHTEGAELKCICDECSWKGDESQALRAISPFDPEHELIGCPECKQPSVLVRACYKDGCWRPTTCGYPMEGGYECACSEHHRMEFVRAPR